MLTAVVLTKNEEKNIGICLENLKWCGETIVIDDNSQDKTVEIAKKHGAKVYIRALGDNFSEQRNFGLDKAGGDWVLFVDADERISERLSNEVKKVIRESGNKIIGYYIKRRDVMWDKELKYGETGNIKLLRLAKKDAGKWKRAVHEVWDVRGEIGELQTPLMHYPHQTLNEFIKDIERYSTLHAKELDREGKRSSVLKIYLWPKLKFLNNWVFKFGFLDGNTGFVLAMFMSFHSYLAWSKLWLMQKHNT